MTPKKKDSPELFEVFRSAVRDREDGPVDLEAVSSAERESLVAEAPEAPARDGHPRSAEPTPASGMGERRVAVKYNTVVLGLMAVVGSVFISFAMGVRWGEDRAVRAPQPVPTDDGKKLAQYLGPVSGGPREVPSVPTEGVTQQPQPEEPSPPVVRPPAGHETQPPAVATGKYWVRLIDFDAGDSSAASLVAYHVKKLKEKGFDQAMERLRKGSSGAKLRAVCYGPFQTKAEASGVLPKLQAVNQKAYKQADIFCDE